jgi:preprotein translocase subunit YajC
VFITSAYAQAAGAPGQGDLLTTMLPMIAIFVVFYFLLIRPQQKKAKEHRTMIDALEKGAEVVTAGGVVGRVSKLADAYVTLEIAAGVEVTVQKQAVSQLLPKGTLKSL